MVCAIYLFVYLWNAAMCCTTMSLNVLFWTNLSWNFLFAAHIIYKALVFVFSFHYFLYVALVKHKVWTPKDYSAFVESAVMHLCPIVLLAFSMPRYQELHTHVS